MDLPAEEEEKGEGKGEPSKICGQKLKEVI